MTAVPLPVFKYKEEILTTIKNNLITLIIGETGSGKTTQIPQYLLEWDFITASNKIVCTQPRTVAATSVALRVSEEQKCELGTIVGYHIRLDRKITENITKLEYMTEGVLLRKAMTNNKLIGYGIVIIDEAHERTVNADLLMGYLKYNKIKLVIMSATLDIARFKKYFTIDNNLPPIISIPGSLHCIKHYWLNKATDDYIKLIIDTILAIHNNGYNEKDLDNIPDGHILVFLTGQQEIDNIIRIIENYIINNTINNLEIYPLYASLSNKERQKAFDEPLNILTRKCVIATNIAETSLTISNIVYVIDCGLSKQKLYSSSKGLEALGIKTISKASVKQRCGRAGRLKPGKAYHLYTLFSYKKFTNETYPEILRSNLISQILSMLSLGIKNPLKFDFIDAPNQMTIARAINILYYLNAIDNNGKITNIGLQMAKFPINPLMAKCLLMSIKLNCVYEICVIAAMLENIDKLWRKPKDDKKSDFHLKKKLFYHVSGDHLTLLNIYNTYKQKIIKNANINYIRSFCKSNYWDYCTLEKVDQIKNQLQSILLSLSNNISGNTFKLNNHKYIKYYDNIIKCLLYGYFMNVAVQGFGNKYWRFNILTLDNDISNKTINIIDKTTCHPTSIFYKNNNQRNWIIFDQVQISHTTQLRVLTAIKPIWLIQIQPNYYDIKGLIKDKSPIAKVLIASGTN